MQKNDCENNNCSDRNSSAHLGVDQTVGQTQKSSSAQQTIKRPTKASITPSNCQEFDQTATCSAGNNSRQPHLRAEQVASDRNQCTMFVITAPQCTIKCRKMNDMQTWQRLSLCLPQVGKKRPSVKGQAQSVVTVKYRAGPPADLVLQPVDQSRPVAQRSWLISLSGLDLDR